MSTQPASTSIKAANPNPAATEQMKREHAALIANAIAMSLGLGGLTAAGTHGWGLLNRKVLPTTMQKLSPTAPLMSRKSLEDDKDKAPKLASADAWAGKNWWESTAGKLIYDNLMKTPKGGYNFMGGDEAKGPMSNPMVLGLGIPASLLAFYAGNKAVGSMGTRMRKAERDQELTREKQRYEELLKVSADEAWEKLANDTPQSFGKGLTQSLGGAFGTVVGGPARYIADNVGGAMGEAMQSGMEAVRAHPASGATAGGLTAWALLSGLLAGKFTHDAFKDKKQQKMLASAVRRRAEQRRQQHLPATRLRQPDEERLYA